MKLDPEIKKRQLLVVVACFSTAILLPNVLWAVQDKPVLERMPCDRLNVHVVDISFPDPARGPLEGIHDRSTTLFRGTEVELNDRPGRLPRRPGVGFRVPPVMFSPTGEFLYFVADGKTIRKVDTNKFSEIESIKTHGKFRAICYSKAGVVFIANASNGRSYVWTVDRATLAPQRVIKIPSAEWVVANPTTDIGFAFASNLEPSLFMIDFQQGKILGCWTCRFREDERTHTIWNNGFILFRSAQMSPDGKFLFVGSSQRIMRFRIEEDDLVLEETSNIEQGLPLFGIENFSLDIDGKSASLRGVHKKSGSYNSYFFDALELKSKPLKIITDHKCFDVARDPVTNNIYATTWNRKFLILDESGKLLQDTSIMMLTAPKILVHPGGERVVLWQNNKFVYCDLRTE